MQVKQPMQTVIFTVFILVEHLYHLNHLLFVEIQLLPLYEQRPKKSSKSFANESNDCQINLIYRIIPVMLYYITLVILYICYFEDY